MKKGWRNANPFSFMGHLLAIDLDNSAGRPVLAAEYIQPVVGLSRALEFTHVDIVTSAFFLYESGVAHHE